LDSIDRLRRRHPYATILDPHESTIEEIYNKLLKGDPITDDELERGIYHFQNICRFLDQCGPVFHLASKESRRVYMELESFRDSRKGRK
jgi:hypothetical protein